MAIDMCNEQLTQGFVVRPAQPLSDLQDRPFDLVLPVRTLRNVRDFELNCLLHSFGERECTTWSQLTNLTKLALHCQASDKSQYYFLECLTDLRSLREVETTTEIYHLDSSGQDYLVLIARCLRQLTRLQINVAEPRDSDLFPVAFKSSKLERVCQSVCRRVPGMLGSLADVITQDRLRKTPLIFTLDR